VDLYLPDGSGIDLLKDLELGSTTEVVLMTGHADVESAVQALRLGASDYLTKPLDIGRLKSILANVASVQQPQQASAAPVQGEAQESDRLGLLLGASPSMQAVYEMLTRVARSKAPFMPLNCGAISPTLIESELFGHERGSFTGAARRHKGYFERAHMGTLFLDEITEMPIELQVKLLRVLETGALNRIGGDAPVDVDVRVVAATNRDPQKAVNDGKLREDLLYRLQVFPIHMPPLSERGEDIQLLADYFLAQLNERQGTTKRVTDESMERLRSHNWPGNVRELKNVVHRAFIMADQDITPRALPREVGGDSGFQRSLSFQVGTSIEEVERRLIMATLEANGGNKRQTADVLGVSLKTLYNRLNSYRDV
jgi:two-component system response regulator AtoC